jgi:hypothetical protein
MVYSSRILSIKCSSSYVQYNAINYITNYNDGTILLPPNTSLNAWAINLCWLRLQWFSSDRTKGKLKDKENEFYYIRVHI